MSTKNNRRDFSTAEVIAAFKANDRSLTARVYEMYYPAVLKYILQNSGDESDAKDIYQEAFIALWRNIKADRLTEKSGANLGGYIFQIARYKWLDKLKSVRHKSTVRLVGDQSVEEEEPSAETLELEAQFDAMNERFNRLGEGCRRILKMFYYEKCSLEEIGKSLNYSASVIRTKKYRCMMKLRKMDDTINSDD